MNFRNYFSLWLLLAVAFAAIVALSAFSPVRIGAFELRDSGIYEALTKTAEEEPEPMADNSLRTQSAQSSQSTPMQPQAAPAAEVDSSAMTLLLIGDSMLEGLSPRLAAYANANGHTLYSVIWYSSTSEVWGRSDKLKNYINRLHPDFVFISLGANELFVKDIAAKRDKYVKKIIADIGSIPYLWIGPPNWKPDTGINDLIAANAAPGSFFLSNGMHFDRAKDGAHPTRSSAAAWMDSVVRWMPAHSSHPFRLDKPSAATGSPRRIFVHQPNER